jgi:hypothetical protein
VQTLDELLSQEPDGTFHDATVVELQYDRAAGSAFLTADLWVPTAVDRERRRRGRLTLSGVRLWRKDAPESAASVASEWLTAEGPLAEATTELGRTLHRDFQTEPFCWYFYFSDSNSFLYWTAREVTFEWEGPAQPAA